MWAIEHVHHGRFKSLTISPTDEGFRATITVVFDNRRYYAIVYGRNFRGCLEALGVGLYHKELEWKLSKY